MPPQLKALSELGRFLGKKLDEVVSAIRNTPQKLEIDLGASSKELADAAKALADVSKAIEANEQARDMKPVIDQLKGVLAAVERQATATTALAGKTDADTVKRTNTLLGAVLEAIQANRPTTPEAIDLSGLTQITTVLLALQRELEAKDTHAVEAKLTRLIELFEKFKFEAPGTLKIDKDQFKALLMASGSSVGGGSLAPRNRIVANIDMTTQATEYSYTFPPGTVNFYMKLRDVGNQFQYAWISGESATVYMTSTYNFLQSRDNVEFGGRTIYFQCATAASMVMEIESYQA